MSQIKAVMVDLSSNNGRPKLSEHYAAGYRVIALKVTEGTTYRWADGEQLAQEWHKLGEDAIVWHYHFARPGSGRAQADYFLRAVRPRYQTGDRLVIDCEVAGVTHTLVRAFINRCHKQLRAAPGAIYGGPYFLRDAEIVSTHGWGLWLADYAARIAFVPPGFGGKVLAWQYTDRARGVPGIPGAVDRSTLDNAALPHRHRHRRRGPTRLHHRDAARELLRALAHRHHAVPASDRVLLDRLRAAITATLDRKAGK